MSLLDVKNLKVEFETADGVVSAVNNVNFSIDEGKILKKGSPKELTQELGSSGITIKVGDAKNKFNSFLSDYSYTFSDNRLHFSVKNPDVAMPDIIQRLSKNNIKIQSVESNSSSLEDVFLDLTGKGIDE